MNNWPRITPSATLLQDLKFQSSAWRATCIQMAKDGKHGHLSSSLSCVDLLVVLYRFYIQKQVKNNGNKFILSKGHGCTAQYVAMAAHNHIPMNELGIYAKKNSKLQCHPCKHLLPELHVSSGSLGQGFGMATGIALGKKLKGDTGKVVVIVGDGECNEGSVWEAAMLSAAQRLNNLLLIVDYNNIQAVGRSDELMGNTNLEDKFNAFGWGAKTINGNDSEEIIDAVNQFPFISDKPSVIIAHTKTGVSFMDDDVLWHYRVPSEKNVKEAFDELNAFPIHYMDKV